MVADAGGRTSEPIRVAIASRGGESHTAFTAGVREDLLLELDRSTNRSD